MHPVGIEPLSSKSSESSWQPDNIYANGLAASDSPSKAHPKAASLAGKARTIFLMSHDLITAGKLQAAAALEQRTVECVGETFTLFRMLQGFRPAAVLLDLDMHTGAAWEAADRLLLNPNCPPLVLLTGRVKDPDFSLAEHSGCIVDKFTAPLRLMQIVDQTIEAAPSARDERIAIQRITVLRLNPFHPAEYRDFGIND